MLSYKKIFRYYFNKKNRILQLFDRIKILCRKKFAFFVKIHYNIRVKGEDTLCKTLRRRNYEIC